MPMNTRKQKGSLRISRPTHLRPAQNLPAAPLLGGKPVKGTETPMNTASLRVEQTHRSCSSLSWGMYLHRGGVPLMVPRQFVGGDHAWKTPIQQCPSFWRSVDFSLQLWILIPNPFLACKWKVNKGGYTFERTFTEIWVCAIDLTANAF